MGHGTVGVIKTIDYQIFSLYIVRVPSEITTNLIGIDLLVILFFKKIAGGLYNRRKRGS